MTDAVRNFKTRLGTLLLAGNLLACGLAHAVEVPETMVREAVEAHVKEALKAHMPVSDQMQLTVDVLKLPGAPYEFSNTDALLAVKLETESTLPQMYSERAIVRVRMGTDVDPAREIGVPVRLVIKKPVWVVKNMIRANVPLKASDFTLKLRDVSHTYQHAVGKERNLGQYIARVNLRPGEVLDDRKIIIPPDIRYNHAVRIFITSPNGMTVSVPGVALSDGRIGETIRVRQTLYKRQTMAAKVISKNQVLVEM